MDGIHVSESLPIENGAILSVVQAAFGDRQGNEVAKLTSDLLIDSTAKPMLSLVAKIRSKIVGHILFSTTRISRSNKSISSVILAPLSVHPAFQNCGIGGQLIRSGCDQLKTKGVDLVFVLGHQKYYPKYGFITAFPHGLKAPYPIPDAHAEAWMVRELRPGILGTCSGGVECAESLMHPEHWRE